MDFSVPYNNDHETLEQLFTLKKIGKNRIREVYLSGPQQYIGAGRVAPIISLNEFKKVVYKIHNEDIKVNLVLNSTCEGNEWYSSKIMNDTLEYIRQVHEIDGVEVITLSNPIYIIEVRKCFPKIDICASVLGDIDCVQRALIYRSAGANVITPDVCINRNFNLLREIRNTTNVELKMMVNEGCLYKCPFRKFHFNATSHASRETRQNGIDNSFANFFNACLAVTSNDLSQVLRSGWIRPEDTSKYSKISGFFKIVGRSQPRSVVIRTVRAYLEENWEGSLFDILCASLQRFSSAYGAYLDNKKLEEYDFFKVVTKCGNICTKCEYCKSLATSLIEFGVITPEKIEDSYYSVKRFHL